jgi:hypothetical protein
LKENPEMSSTRTRRQFDLVALFVVSFAFAVLFALLSLFELGAADIGVIAGFFVTVGLAQALILGGQWPRIVSMITGAVFLLMYAAIQGNVPQEAGLVCLQGVMNGYVAGLIIADVFQVADIVRKRMTRVWVEAKSPDATEDTTN